MIDVIADRVSVREFSTPSATQLGCVLARSGLSRSHGIDATGTPISRRAAPSAGARHPFELVLAAHDVEGLDAGLWVLDPDAAVLRASEVTASEVAEALDAIAQAMSVRRRPPAAIFVVADPTLTLSRYPNGISLLWREAGALLMLIHLTATDLGLGSCIVGTTGALCADSAELRTPVDLGAVALGGRC